MRIAYSSLIHCEGLIMLGQSLGNCINEFLSDYVVFDFETTGLNPFDGDRIIEMSAVRVTDDEVSDTFSTLVNPEQPISPEATMVNGITDDMVADAPCMKEALTDFIDFIGDDILVGHNIRSFDMNFLKMECMLQFGGLVPTNDYVDTLLLAKRCMPEMAHKNLTVLAEHFGISPEGAHRALADCLMNQKVYELLKEETERFENGDKTIPVCSICGRRMVIRKSKFGEFWGCTGYPNCKNTINILK